VSSSGPTDVVREQVCPLNVRGHGRVPSRTSVTAMGQWSGAAGSGGATTRAEGLAVVVCAKTALGAVTPSSKAAAVTATLRK
jgi:hypothetical protein